MKAVLVKQPGSTDQLYLGEALTPEPDEQEILVKVKAAALNRMDILQRRGMYPVPAGASPILGVDIAGVVAKPARCGSHWKTGDRVMGLLSGGGYAEYATLHEELAMPMPPDLSFAEAAAVPEVFLVAHQALAFLGDVQAETSVLIHAGASGVGTAAIQLVRAMGAHAFVTAGSSEKIDLCRRLGADGGVNYHEGPFADKILEATRGKGVSTILDFVGAPYWEQNLRVLRTDGRLILIGYMGGRRVADVDLGLILTKRIHVIGTTLRARSLGYRIRLVQSLDRFARDRFADGRLRPIVDRVFDWKDVRQAHRYMEENRNKGKIILEGM